METFEGYLEPVAKMAVELKDQVRGGHESIRQRVEAPFFISV